MESVFAALKRGEITTPRSLLDALYRANDSLGDFLAAIDAPLAPKDHLFAVDLAQALDRELTAAGTPQADPSPSAQPEITDTDTAAELSKARASGRPCTPGRTTARRACLRNSDSARYRTGDTRRRTGRSEGSRHGSASGQAARDAIARGRRNDLVQACRPRSCLDLGRIRHCHFRMEGGVAENAIRAPSLAARRKTGGRRI